MSTPTDTEPVTHLQRDKDGRTVGEWLHYLGFSDVEHVATVAGVEFWEVGFLHGVELVAVHLNDDYQHWDVRRLQHLGLHPHAPEEAKAFARNYAALTQ